MYQRLHNVRVTVRLADGYLCCENRKSQQYQRHMKTVAVRLLFVQKWMKTNRRASSSVAEVG